MQKRGAIGLSINTLVIVIISMVILGGGITMMYKFISGAEDTKNQLDAKTDAELERLLVDQGKPVALPLHVATVEAGETHVFGLGILNIKQTTDDFNIEVTIAKIVDKEQNNLIDADASLLETANSYLLYNTESVTIKQNGHHKESILVDLPEDAKKGQYIYKARVKDKDSKLHGNPQTFYVNVK